MRRLFTLAGILAAVMSTIDAQLLTLSSMLGRDVIRRYTPTLDDAAEVRLGRLFTLVIGVVTYVIVLLRPASIFEIATFSFSGYVMLVPTLFLSLWWRGFTAAGAIASIVVGNAVLLALFTLDEPVLGLLPVAWGLLAAVVAGALAASVLIIPVKAWLNQREELAHREAQLERLESSNERLAADVARLETDQGIADAVREELGAVHVDEKVYRIVMDPQLLALLPEGWLYPTISAVISAKAGIAPPVVPAVSVPAVTAPATVAPTGG